ncbi:MAG: response regulator, partial [Rubrivivax sp.]
DLRDAADILAQAIELDGYSVRTAYGGEEALSLAMEQRPDCVLLDIAMPGMDGYELATQLRDTYGHDIVLIAITGMGDKSDRVDGTIKLVDHFLRKPVDTKALRKLLPMAID